MAFTAAQFDVAGTEVSLGAASADQFLIRTTLGSVWLGPTGVTPATGFRLDPEDGPRNIPDVAGTDELFAIGLASKPARVHILRRPIA